MSLFTLVTISTIAAVSVTGASQRSEWIAMNESQWENQQIACNPNEPCTIICSMKESCKLSTITCPENDTCALSCISSGACARATIYPPIDPELFNFTWNGYDSLQNVEYPFYEIDDYENLTLNCDGYGKCANLKLVCPKYAYCNLNCSASSSCAGVESSVFF